MPRKRKTDDDWVGCPNCGAELPRGAKFCRECGASDDSGWGDEAEEGFAGGGYSDDDFDYDEFVEREFPENAPSRGWRPKKVALLVIAVLVCLALLMWMFLPLL
jgi:hypothetical protein